VYTTTAAAPSLGHGTLLGSITLSGLAACALLLLILGVRGSDTIKINTKQKVTLWSLLTGSLMEAAGGNWNDVITGIGSIPESINSQSGFGDWGAAGKAIFLTLAAWGPKWKRMLYPMLFALTASVYWIKAGGIGAIILNAARTTLGNLGSM
jgi:hypothetical protein